ncbi:MAG: phospho-sugar mutase, partial [Ruminococcus sp.]|nr:phospho-sugar mutase [Ruminococcus sp.]
PDGNFTTCPFPNPEIKEALALGLKLCDTLKPDLLLATDPDCDRVGIAVPSPVGDYVLFSGNETGALLMEYVCSERKALGTMPEKPVAVKTIVTTDIVNKMAEEYGVELREVLTGFKFIGEQIGFLEADGEDDRYIFGFEESYGYLAGSYVRDKDAVVASMLICEMAAFYRTKGISLLDARDKMYAKYGNYLHSQESFTCEGASGMQRMQEIMKDLRENTPKEIGGLKVESFGDYLASKETCFKCGKVSDITLPKSDVLSFKLEQGASVIIRPSGTEPKIKAYYTTIGETRAAAEEQQAAIKADFKAKLGF